jgi:hypothetical protein
MRGNLRSGNGRWKSTKSSLLPVFDSNRGIKGRLVTHITKQVFNLPYAPAGLWWSRAEGAQHALNHGLARLIFFPYHVIKASFTGLASRQKQAFLQGPANDSNAAKPQTTCS